MNQHQRRLYAAKLTVLRIERKLRRVTPKSDPAAWRRLNRAWGRHYRRCLDIAVVGLRHGMTTGQLQDAVAAAYATTV